MNNDFFSSPGHDYDNYERSHKGRLDFLVEDLKLNELNGYIADFGCGLGFLYYRLKPELQKTYVGYDYTELNNPIFEYKKVDMNNFVAEDKEKFDYAFCFEVLEHLSNPFNCLMQIKNLLKKDGILYLSIPGIECTHNAIYPTLFYSVENFKIFLYQMAFEIIRHTKHNSCFNQEVFVLKNKGWDYSKMLFYKSEEKFRGIDPQTSVNL